MRCCLEKTERLGGGHKLDLGNVKSERGFQYGSESGFDLQMEAAIAVEGDLISIPRRGTSKTEHMHFCIAGSWKFVLGPLSDSFA